MRNMGLASAPPKACDLIRRRPRALISQIRMVWRSSRVCWFLLSLPVTLHVTRLDRDAACLQHHNKHDNQIRHRVLPRPREGGGEEGNFINLKRSREGRGASEGQYVKPCTVR